MRRLITFLLITIASFGIVSNIGKEASYKPVLRSKQIYQTDKCSENYFKNIGFKHQSGRWFVCAQAPALFIKRETSGTFTLYFGGVYRDGNHFLIVLKTDVSCRNFLQTISDHLKYVANNPNQYRSDVLRDVGSYENFTTLHKNSKSKWVH